MFGNSTNLRLPRGLRAPHYHGRVCASSHRLEARCLPALVQGVALVDIGDAKKVAVSDVVDPDIDWAQPTSSIRVGVEVVNSSYIVLAHSASTSATILCTYSAARYLGPSSVRGIGKRY